MEEELLTSAGACVELSLSLFVRGGCVLNYRNASLFDMRIPIVDSGHLIAFLYFRMVWFQHQLTMSVLQPVELCIVTTALAMLYAAIQEVS